VHVKGIIKFIYGFLAAVFLLAGAGIALLDTGLLPGGLSRALSDAAGGDAGALHIVQEFGAFLVFAGLITLWFVRHYEQSRFFHWALTAAFGLVALAHWFDVRGTRDSNIGPLVNSVPFVLFLVLGLLRRSSERAREETMNAERGTMK
jgi:hypothetical protein